MIKTTIMKIGRSPVTDRYFSHHVLEQMAEQINEREILVIEGFPEGPEVQLDRAIGKVNKAKLIGDELVVEITPFSSEYLLHKAAYHPNGIGRVENGNVTDYTVTCISRVSEGY